MGSSIRRTMGSVTIAIFPVFAGDGKIFVYGLDHVVRIRTSQTDADAI
jgi:nitrogen regulatory protein PII